MDMDEDRLQELAQFKDVAHQLQDLQHQYANAGDTASVQTLAQMGLDFANRFAAGDSVKSLFSGTSLSNASQGMVLEALDQNTSYDFPWRRNSRAAIGGHQTRRGVTQCLESCLFIRIRQRKR